MYYRLCKFLAIIIVSLMVMACATTPKVKEPDSDHIAAAKRFLKAFEADKLAMIGFKRAMETESKKYPEGVVEFTQRVMSDIKAEDVIDIIARIYARHLTQKHLTELARFSESPTGKRLIRMTTESVMEGIPPAKAQNEIMTQFNADELTEIMKFMTTNPASIAMNKAQPMINRDLSEAGRQFVQNKIREYLEKQSGSSSVAHDSQAVDFRERGLINNANAEEDSVMESPDPEYMRNSIWHIDFSEVDGKPIPTSSISYVDRKGISNITDVGAAPSRDSSCFAVVEVHNKEMALILRSSDKAVQQKVLFKTAIGERLCAWPAWSPSGDQIAIIHGQFDLKKQHFSHNIIIADINGSKISRHRLPKGTLNFPLVMAPFNQFSWSPDGKKILISWDKAGVLNVDTGRFIKMSDSPIIAEWAPNSNSVYYFDVESDVRKRGLKNFYKIDLDSAKPTKLADESGYKQNGLRHSSCIYGHLNLSPSGSKMMFAGGSNDEMQDVIRIYSIERDKPIDIFKPLQKLPVDAIIMSTQWASDEKSIAVLVIRVKPSMELTVEILNLETQEKKTVTKIDLPKKVSEIEIIDLIGTVKSLCWTK
jgi:hypothetical protein